MIMIVGGDVLDAPNKKEAPEGALFFFIIILM